MIRVLATFLLTCALVAAAEPSEKKTAPAKPAAKQKTASKTTPGAISIPSGAREIEPGTFLHVDAKGKRWIYRRTPFGVSRWEDKQEGAERSATGAEKDQLAATTAVEDGDVVRFSRPGPFGTYKWSKKKDQLDAEEQSIWKREQERAAKSNERKQE
jgi:hypothetical protein